MTEMETLQRAKMYMEKLANGINPIDETVIPDGDVVNNVRLSRCFFYVADVLRQVIDNGGTTPPPKPQKKPFVLSDEQKSNFVFSHTPITVTELSKRINALSQSENMKKLGYTLIQDWLMSLGMLEETLDGNGKKVKRPTAQGDSVGIALDARTGMNGAYFVVVYNSAAQHFIVDNLDGIIAFEQERKENQGKPWEPEQDRQLLELYRQNVAIREIALILKRNSGAIRARLKKLEGITDGEQ